MYLSINQDLIDDFRDEFEDAYHDMEGILISLEKTTEKTEQLHALFRLVHSIKSKLLELRLDTLSEFVHVMENVLDGMCAGSMTYDTRFSDVMLLGFDKVHDAFERIVAGDRGPDPALEQMRATLEMVSGGEILLAEGLDSLLLMLDPQAASVENETPGERSVDLDFFDHVARYVEHRLNYESGSTDRILEMARQMNEAAGTPVNPEQLKAAVYIHDIGMAFLPQSVLQKTGELTPEERKRIQQHPEFGSNLLEQLSLWQQAAEIVCQHHEHFDGGGYPNGRRGEDICHGARLLAIADTFESMTHKRAYREHKRTVLRVVAEINGQAGKQFDGEWVNVFNLWVRKNYVKQA